MKTLNCLPPHPRTLCLLLVLAFVGGSLSGALAVERRTQAKGTDSAQPKRMGGHPYCGLYCVYSLLRLSGDDIDFGELLTPDYISSRKGSSFEELTRAARNNGLYAETTARLTTDALRNSPYPIILHVKSDAAAVKDYDHFLIYLGCENGKAKLFDPPLAPELMPFHELAPIWDGAGLIVSAEPIEHGRVFAPINRRLMLYAALAIALILALHWAKQRFIGNSVIGKRRLLGFSVAQGATFALIALLCGFFCHLANDAGFLANASAAKAVREAHWAGFIPKVSAGEVKERMKNGTVILDARMSRDYESGHIDGAISLPVDANDAVFDDETAQIAKDSEIVIYCQSSGCPYAQIVTKKLLEHGYSDISIFKGGWVEWKEKMLKDDKETAHEIRQEQKAKAL